MLSVLPLYYSFDGADNNLTHPSNGSAGSDLLQTPAPAYGDGISTPAGADRPGAREISNVLAAQPNDITNARHMSDWIYAWGQFVDHDLSFTPAGTTQQLPIPVPSGDPDFDPNSTGAQTIPFDRAAADPATGTSASNPLQHPNTVTSFLDGSQVYGSDATRAAALRTFQGGHLKTSASDLLPFDAAGLPMTNDTGQLPLTDLFLTGDVRGNENIELTAVQTLFVREHNYWADKLAAKNPSWTDEQLYQSARQIVIAEIQSITYNEFLPALLGSNAVTTYAGYDPNVNPGVSAEFSEAAYRFGHSVLNSTVDFFNEDGSESHNAVPFNLAADAPSLLTEPGAGVDNILKYLSADQAQEEDEQVEDDFRNMLFAGPGQGGLDLYAIDIQRGRDLGLPDYNTVRVAYGLPAVTNFAQITSDPTLQSKLQQLYGNVNNIDLFVGGLAEDHVTGGSLGPTFTRIIADQFERTRDGDRFWFQRIFSGSDLQMIENTTLADVIRRDSGVTNLQADVFFFSPGTISGAVFDDANGSGTLDSGELGIGGVTVRLLDGAGNLVSQTVTAADGSYHFDGLEQGASFRVQVAPRDATDALTTPTSQSVQLADNTGDGQFGVDFGYSASEATRFVERLYQDVLNRAADDAGLSFFTSLLSHGGQTSQVVQQVFDSPEHRALEADHLYETYLHRPAEAAGRASLSRLLSSGTTETAAVEILVNSAEYAALHPTPASLVAAIYSIASAGTGIRRCWG